MPVCRLVSGIADARTDAQTFVQFLILSRYVYVKVGLEAFVKKFISEAILKPWLNEDVKDLFHATRPPQKHKQNSPISEQIILISQLIILISEYFIQIFGRIISTKCVIVAFCLPHRARL